MRRHIAPLLLACSILTMLAAACSSTDDAAKAPPTTAPGAAAGAAGAKTGASTLSAAKCRTLHAFQQTTIVANKPDSQQPANQEKVTKALTSTSAAVKKAFAAKTGSDPQVRQQTDKQVTYLMKLVKVQNPSSTEKDESTKARDAMQRFAKTNCAATSGAAKAPGTTAPAAKATTTVAPSK